MYVARAVSHQITSSVKPKPVPADSSTTSASGAPSANDNPCKGQISPSTMPA
jgi:hypothetical protein